MWESADFGRGEFIASVAPRGLGNSRVRETHGLKPGAIFGAPLRGSTHWGAQPSNRRTVRATARDRPTV